MLDKRLFRRAFVAPLITRNNSSSAYRCSLELCFEGLASLVLGGVEREQLMLDENALHGSRGRMKAVLPRNRSLEKSGGGQGTS